MTGSDLLKNLAILEGRYTVDDGGPTECGITQSAWNTWCTFAHRAPKSVATLTPQDVSDFYLFGYIGPLLLANLPDGVDFCLFQWAVNHEFFGGTGPAVRDLQICVGASPDRVMGPETVADANAMDRIKLMECLLARQEAWYQADAKTNPDAPLIGWENRIEKVREIVGLTTKGDTA